MDKLPLKWCIATSAHTLIKLKVSSFESEEFVTNVPSFWLEYHHLAIFCSLQYYDTELAKVAQQRADECPSVG